MWAIPIFKWLWRYCSFYSISLGVKKWKSKVKWCMLKTSSKNDKFLPFWNCCSGINFDHSLNNVGVVTFIDVLCIQFWQCLVIQPQEVLNKRFISSNFCIVLGWILCLWLVRGCNLIPFARIKMLYIVVFGVWHLQILLLQGVQTNFSCFSLSCGSQFWI